MPVDANDVGDNCGNCRFSRVDPKKLDQYHCCHDVPSAIALPSNNQISWMSSITPVVQTHWCGEHEPYLPQPEKSC